MKPQAAEIWAQLRAYSGGCFPPGRHLSRRAARSNRWARRPGGGADPHAAENRPSSAHVGGKRLRRTRGERANSCGAVIARGADPFQQPLQKSDRRGRRGGCDDPNTNQWKWHTGQAWPAPPPSCSPTRACTRVRGRLPRHRRLRAYVTRTRARELRLCAYVFVPAYLRRASSLPGWHRAARRWGEGKVGARLPTDY